MTLSIPPGFGSAAIIFNGSGGTAPYVTTIGVDLSGAGGDFVAAANSVMTAYSIAFGDDWASSLTLEKVNLAVGQDGPGGSVESDVPPKAGAKGGEFPPIAMAVIAKKVTNSLGRSGRGRMYLPGLAREIDINENGTLGGDVVTALNGALENFLLTLSTPALNSPGSVAVPAVLLHSKGLGAPVPTPIVGMSLASKIGWIRGRLR